MRLWNLRLAYDIKYLNSPQHYAIISMEDGNKFEFLSSFQRLYFGFKICLLERSQTCQENLSLVLTSFYEIFIDLTLRKTLL